MNTTDPSAVPTPSLAIIGGGPVGLSLALLAARRLPQATVTVYDSLPREHDISRDPRTLALSLGTVQELQRLGVWAQIEPQAMAIAAVHVSQQQPAVLGLLAPRWLRQLPGADVLAQALDAEPAVVIRAAEEGVPQLGAVAAYGQIVAPLRAAWLAACEAEPQRLRASFGTPVTALTPVDGGAEVDAGVVERHDLAVVAEGGVFADQARKAVHHDYRQTAWVGTVTLEGAEPGMAFERFTPSGPAALLPLPPKDGQQRASLVWCVNADDDPVRDLTDAQRLAVLGTIFPDVAGHLTGLSPLKHFALGLNAEASLVSGRTVRIGNAAQTLHPVAGQGLNLGVRDAHELLEHLAREATIDAALRRFGLGRAPDRWAMIAATDFLARSFTWPVPGLSTVRGAGMAALQRLGPVKSLLARRMMFGAR